jgi:hypothetical protein
VKFHKKRGGGLSMVYSVNKTSSRILDFLKRIEGRIWTADEERVAII